MKPDARKQSAERERLRTIKQLAATSKALTALFKSNLALAKAMGLKGPRAVRHANTAVINLASHDCIATLDVEGLFKKNPADWYTQEELINDFLAQCCVFDAAATEGATALYHAYRTWCESTGIAGRAIPGQRGFGITLSRRFDKFKNGSVHYKGLCLSDHVKALEPAAS